MKKIISFLLLCTASVVFSAGQSFQVQQSAAEGVIERLIGAEFAEYFDVEISRSDGAAYFEVESQGDRIVLRGDCGSSACRALKWYLNNKCSSSISWRGDNLNLSFPLPRVETPVREESLFKYRYIFNYCTFGYSFAFWDWEEWERMIDILAFNGINMPLALLGQEAAWQKTYEKFGLTAEDLRNFFAGPAFYSWQWMGNLDGWGGVLPQSVIDRQFKLQKQILARQRSLGMTPVTAGFAGHVPKALKRKFPEIKVHELNWAGFPATHSLDWQEPLFRQIGTEFIRTQNELYGSDHYYAIDPFNEMNPTETDLNFISRMADTIFSSMNEADPQSKWVIQTWCFKSPELPGNYWIPERTKAFFDAVPDERMIALELHAESWYYTGWRKQSGWYNKPWIWSAIQNFGDRVDLYGGLSQIFENYNKMITSPGKGNLQGMGIMMEGLGYNPVVYELLFDMMWGEGVKSLEGWQSFFLKKRYGQVTDNISKAWELLFGERYKTYLLKDLSSLCYSPSLRNSDIAVEPTLIEAWKLMALEADSFEKNPAFTYDFIHLSREVLGQYAGHYSYLLNRAWKKRNLTMVQNIGAEFLEFIKDFDTMLNSIEDFRFGKWRSDARALGSSDSESDLMEFNSKVQITRWTLGNDAWGLNNYAVKEWGGYIGQAIYPQWEKIISLMIDSLGGEKSPYNSSVIKSFSYFNKKQFIENWINTPSSVAEKNSTPVENPAAFAKQLFVKYYAKVSSAAGTTSVVSSAGILKDKPVTKSGRGPAISLQNINDGKTGWPGTRVFRSAGSLVFDLGESLQVFGFQLYAGSNLGRPLLYKIEVSADKLNWQTAVDQSSNTEPPSKTGYLHKFKIFNPDGIPARYIRLTILNDQCSVVLNEFKAFAADDEF